MPTPRYYRAVSLSGSTYTELPNVLALSVDIGRRALLDTFNPSEATFTYRRINSSTPVPTIGDRIYLVDYVTGSTAQQIAQNNDLLFVGIVRDAAIQYAPSSAEDTITVSCEAALADLGRNYLVAQSFAHDPLATYVSNLATAAGYSIPLYNAGASEDLHAQDWTGSAADLLRLIANTVYGRLVELDQAVALLAKNYVQTASWKFSDAGTGTFQVYDDIVYESLADNYYTEIVINYPIDQTSTQGSGQRVLSLDTISRNATNAATVGNYYKNTFSSPVMGLAAISAKASAQSTFRLAKVSTLGAYQGGIYNCVGTQLEVDFRGQTLTVIIEGFSISADPSDSRYTFYVSPGDLNSYLVLDNTILGRLDFNKLGF